MRAVLDYEEKGLRLIGQPVVNTIDTNSRFTFFTNPLACCLPSSTLTSSFVKHESLKFIKFRDILHVKLTASGLPNEIQLTFAYIIKPKKISNEYPTDNNIYRVTTQLMKVDDLSDRIWKGNELIDELTSMAYPNGQSERVNYLVLINPNSGQGKAMELYEKEASAIFNGARCNMTVVKTQYAGHAKEIARDLDLKKYDVILCCSGDGLPHEVLNGLYSRKDRVDAFSSLTVAQIPGGSGNAMTLSCLGTSEPSEAALRLLKGQTSQCDLMGVTGWKGDTQNVLVSFLSQTYGMIAQADIGTESLRFLGKVRFDLGVALEVFGNNKYPCDLAIKAIAKNKGELADYYKKQRVSKNKDIEEINESNFEMKHASQFHSASDVLDLPAGWEIYDPVKTEHNSIFYSGKMPYIAAECNFFPAALPNDGAIDIISFDGRSNLASTAKALLSLDKGLHVWEDKIEHFKVEAFRLIPRPPKMKKCYVSVDGEDYPFTPFQVEILPRVLKTVLWKEGEFTETGFSAKLKL